MSQTHDSRNRSDVNDVCPGIEQDVTTQVRGFVLHFERSTRHCMDKIMKNTEWTAETRQAEHISFILFKHVTFCLLAILSSVILNH